MKYNAEIKFSGTGISFNVEIVSDLSPKDLKASFKKDGHKVISLKVV